MNLRSILLEAFLIALGVVMGLAANEWRGEQHAREQAQLALESIREEIAFNRGMVEASRDYHLSKNQMLAALPEGEVPTPRDFERGFVSPARVVDTAWEVAKATDVLTHLPHATVLEVSKVYTQQAAYQDQSATIGPVIYQALYEDGAQGIMENHGNLSGLILSFWYREQELVQRYEEAMTALAP